MKKKELHATETKRSDLSAAAAAAAASKADTKTSVPKLMDLVVSERKTTSAAVSDVKPAAGVSAPSTSTRAEIPHQAAAVVDSSADCMQQMMLKTRQLVPAPQTSVVNAEVDPASKFNRDSFMRSLNEMVSVQNSSRTVEDIQMVEKQRSAFEFAISMYMAATEFYDGGSLWCRQCDCIFTDISSLCRHIHSDKHQLVSYALLSSVCKYHFLVNYSCNTCIHCF